MSSHRNAVSWTVGLVAGVATGVSAYGQAPAGAPQGAREDTLEEVVITAERRAESLNQMAVAGEAFSTAELEKRGINEIEDLAGQTPGLSIKDSGVNRFVTIRGVGLNATTATITSGVAIHVDGVGLWGAGIALGNPFYDLQRVEVLRGPQGTFVGQNSTGGAMYIISKAPTLNGTDFSVEQTLGNYRNSETVAAGNLALTEHTAARLAVHVVRRDSFFKNAGTRDPLFGFPTNDPLLTHQDEPGNNEEQAMRLKYLWQPSDALSVQVWHERFRKRSDGTPQQPIYNFAGNVGGAPTAVRLAIANEIKANTDPYTLAYNSPSRYDVDLDRSSLEITWQITPGLSLRSQSAVQNFTQARLIDTDGTIHPIIPLWQAQGGANPATPNMARAGSPLTETGGWTDTQIGPNRTRTQEFNLLSTTDSPWRWSVGAFYSDQRAQQNNYNSILENNTPATVSGVAYVPRQQTQIMNNRNTQSNAAVFGQVTWRATEQLETIFGLRYNKDKADNPGSTGIVYRPNPQLVSTGAVSAAQTIPSISVGHAESSATTGKLALNWHLSEQQLLYTVVAKGYKAGNFNNQNPLAASTIPTAFLPESVKSIEAGWKSTMFAGHFHTDLTAFRTDYEDYQLNFNDPVIAQTYVGNVAKARIEGFELQMRAQFGGLGANLAASKLSAKIVDVAGRDIRDARRANLASNLTDRRLPFAPPYTLSAGLEYALAVGDTARVRPRIQFSSTGEQWATIFQIPSLVPGSVTAANPTGTSDGGVSPDYLPSYHTVDASLSFEPNEKWMFQIFGTNISDEVYIAGHTGDFRVYSAPLQWGVRFRWQR